MKNIQTLKQRKPHISYRSMTAFVDWIFRNQIPRVLSRSHPNYNCWILHRKVVAKGRPCLENSQYNSHQPVYLKTMQLFQHWQQTRGKLLV